MNDVAVAYGRSRNQALSMPLWLLRLKIWRGRHRDQKTEVERISLFAHCAALRERTGIIRYH